jgi:hypothetical protein
MKKEGWKLRANFVLASIPAQGILVKIRGLAANFFAAIFKTKKAVI